ncbi:protein UL84 [Proboscivirus elephantidbeta5]|uniref:Protein UL84 n=1 Tax=Elephant endotheliotropic herpesvirus 5 TaxID=768738 RepID=A0A075CZQ7_9BETA|nr:protein UL84 [Elephant endotheliotropic herpesvirus 5]AHC02774.1 protein UL84 [Elephant endotheliotropic herpesvirus 5]
MLIPLWCHVTQPPDGTYFTFIEVAIRLTGTLTHGTSQTLLVPMRIWEHTGMGKVFVAGSIENKIDVDFFCVRYSDILGGFCVEISNPSEEPLTLDHEVQRFFLFSPQIFPVSYQLSVLKPPPVSFPRCKTNISSNIKVYDIHENFTVIKIRFCGITWEKSTKYETPTGPFLGPFCMSYPVAVLGLPRGLHAIHHYTLTTDPDACDAEDCYHTRYIISKSCFQKTTLYLILTGAGTSHRACYAKDLSFCGIFSKSHIPEGDEIPQIDPAYNVCEESLSRDTLPISNPSAHRNTFQTFTPYTTALFTPDEWHSPLLTVDVWKAGEILSLPHTFVQSLPPDHKPIIPVGDVVFLATEQPEAGCPNHVPSRKIRCIVSKTHILIFPLNLIFRLDQLNPICLSEKPQCKMTLPGAYQHPSISKELLQNFSIDELQLIGEFFNSLYKMYVSKHVRTVTKNFHGSWNRWPSCQNHQFNQLMFAFYSF